MQPLCTENVVPTMPLEWHGEASCQDSYQPAVHETFTVPLPHGMHLLWAIIMPGGVTVNCPHPACCTVQAEKATVRCGRHAPHAALHCRAAPCITLLSTAAATVVPIALERCTVAKPHPQPKPPYMSRSAEGPNQCGKDIKTAVFYATWFHWTSTRWWSTPSTV